MVSLWMFYHDKLQQTLTEPITRQRGRKLHIVNIVSEKHVQTAVWGFSLCFEPLEVVIGNSGIQSHRVDSVNIGPDLICYTNVVNFKIGAMLSLSHIHSDFSMCGSISQRKPNL